MIWEIITVIALVAVLFLGKKRISFYIWAFIIGVIYGLWWEISAEADFNYTGFSIYIWKDVPLAIILQWGVSIAGFVLISDYFQEKIPIFKRGKYIELKNCFFWDFLVAVIIGISMEIMGSSLFNVWTYPPNDMPSLMFIPLRWLAGWGQIGLFILAFVRRYDKLLEIKWPSINRKEIKNRM